MLRTGGGVVALIEEPQLIYLPLWREAFTWLEYLKLKVAPVYYGFGVPHGDKSPVVVIPGFLGCDAYLLEMRLWLRRVGYRPQRSGIGVNAECPEILAQRLLKTVSRAYARHKRRVHLIGHSLGGVLARSVACMAPDQVASVITLASPFRGVRVNPFVGQALALVRGRVSLRRGCPDDDCFSRSCSCGFSATLQERFPARIHQVAVYSKKDGVVDWQTCINGSLKTDVEVESSHVGMAWNAQVYRIIAERLAETIRRKS